MLVTCSDFYHPPDGNADNLSVRSQAGQMLLNSKVSQLILCGCVLQEPVEGCLPLKLNAEGRALNTSRSLGHLPASDKTCWPTTFIDCCYALHHMSLCIMSLCYHPLKCSTLYVMYKQKISRVPICCPAVLHARVELSADVLSMVISSLPF